LIGNHPKIEPQLFSLTLRKNLRKKILPLIIYRHANAGEIKIAENVVPVAVAFHPAFDGLGDRVCVALVVGDVLANADPGDLFLFRWSPP